MSQGKSSSATVLPKFFKVYTPGESRDDLELPSSFNSSLPTHLPRSVTVRSIYGKNWKLALRKCDGERFVLVDGWKRIAADEGLKERNFLAFEFDGLRCFTFCVFDGSTMCKRLRKTSTGAQEVKSESDGDDGAMDISENESDEDEDVEIVDDDEDDYTRYLDDRTNPSFTMTLNPNPNKRSQLRIPASVINDYNLNFPERVTIVDPLAQNFGPLERDIATQGNSCVFVKKFRSVIRRNKVKMSATMLFELKKTGNNLVHTIKVYVISA